MLRAILSDVAPDRRARGLVQQPRRRTDLHAARRRRHRVPRRRDGCERVRARSPASSTSPVPTRASCSRSASPTPAASAASRAPVRRRPRWSPTCPPRRRPILNADDDRVAGMASVTAARVVTFGQSRLGRLPGRPTSTSPPPAPPSPSSTAALTRRVSLRILGEHHVMNALAALSRRRRVGRRSRPGRHRARGRDPRRALAHGGPRRRPGGVTVINDAYNASPDSVAAALKTLAQITGPEQRSVAVLGEMAELGEYARDEHDRDRPTRRPPQHPASSSSSATRRGTSTWRRVSRARGTARSCWSTRLDEAYDDPAGRPARRGRRAREVVQVGRPAPPRRPPRGGDRMIALLIGGGRLARLHAAA